MKCVHNKYINDCEKCKNSSHELKQRNEMLQEFLKNNPLYNNICDKDPSGTHTYHYGNGIKGAVCLCGKKWSE